MKDHEELHAWQQARVLYKMVVGLVKTRAFVGHGELASQMSAAALSAMGNLAEGLARNSSGQLRLYFNFSIGSAAEVRSHLTAALDIDVCPLDAHKAITAQAHLVEKLTRAFLLALNAHPPNTDAL